MNILQFEKYIDHKIFDLIFNNLELNENAGHPLFNDESSDIGIEFINKIKNALEIVNNKLYTTRPNSTIYNAKFNNKILKAREYEFTILIDKLEFKNIIYSPGAKLKLIVYDILNSDKLTNDDYDILYQAS